MPQYLSRNQPPIYTNIVFNGKLNMNWQRWFSSLYATHVQHFQSFGKTEDENDVPILVHTQMTQTQRDNLTNVQNGATIYNTTTNQMNWYENGAWVTK